MKENASASQTRVAPDLTAAGFTLMEVLVVIAISAIAGLAIVMNYMSQSKAYLVQREMAHMQQNCRAAMYMLQNDIRNAGRDPERTGQFGIQAINRLNGDADDPNGYDGLTMTTLTDTDNDGIADLGAVRTIAYQVIDQNGDGRRELRRCDSFNSAAGVCGANPADWQMVMDGVEDIGFAYAYDDGDDDLARFGGAANAPEIWGIDANNANTLSANSDSNGDGNIDIDDGAPAAINPAIPLNRIRVVRYWILARSRQPYTDFTDTSTYVLGSKIVDLNDPANANRRNFRHWLLSGAVALQNYQLDTNL